MLSQPLFAELGCPTGFIPDGDEKFVDSTFSQGYASFKTDIPFKLPRGQYPLDGNPPNTSAYPNTGISIIDGDVDLDSEVKQVAFPGDPTPGFGLPPVPAVTSWLAYNGVDVGAPTKIWEQEVKNLKPNRNYAFTAYLSNALAPGKQTIGAAAPQISFRLDGVQAGDPVAVCDAGGALDPIQGDCLKEATKDIWQRLGVTINPGNKTTVKLSVHDVQQHKTKFGNDFAMTLISLQECAPIGGVDIDVSVGGNRTNTVIFPAFTLGGSPVSQTITVTNKGTGNLIIGNIGNPANTGFTVVTDNCSTKTLAPAASCTIVMSFSTTTEGTKSSTLSIPSNDPDENPLLLTLKGTTGLDNDNDGIPDDIDLDDDNDGILDSEEGSGDFDGDGVPNHHDLDTDNDTIPDIIEAGGGDADNNGRIDNFIDSNGDGFHDPLAVTPLPRPDTDADGEKDYRDLDSNNDGQFDIAGTGRADVDNNGIVDNFTDPDGDGWDTGRAVLGAGDKGEILTRLDGGVGGFGLPFALALLPLAMRRRRLLAATALLGLGATAQAEQGQFYLGGGFGMSQLEPEIVNLPLTVTEDNDKAFKLMLGYDILNWLSVEGFGARMGSASISNGGDIDYNAFGIGLVASLPDNISGFSLLGKLGYGQIDNSSNDVDFREVEDQEIYAGIGVEYQLENGLSFRGEYEYIDKDAKLITMSLVKRFGNKEKYTPPPVVVAPEPKVVAVEEPAPVAPPAPAEVITLVMEPIYFDTASANLTAEAHSRLNHIVTTMKAHPQVKLLIVGHTDSRGSDDYNLVLSLKRAKAASGYLASQGIDKARLSYEGRGEREPVADNSTREGRARNRRAEFHPTPEKVEKKR
jgi:outer membrane protein OmpA-like peptidoglycan-associated protein